ncbi:hypothetical protein E4U22_005314 [Claviceps purpurea]|nr:hypothetical protein E4U51_003306 [Claviceps purpurea]KAG6253554.1 hypothetical protein E4U23_007610 [Claviceps purpurea]KAG6325039.1 hypothetical protein E4U22_005314 [Claviceps purpurea]
MAAARLLSCRACLSKTARVATYSRSRLASTASRITTAHLGRPSERRYATTASATPEEGLGLPQPGRSPDSDAGHARKQENVKLRRAVKRQLEHLNDSWAVAQRVEETLLKDRFEEALLLTQEASRDGQMVVSWNRLIEYMFKKQQLSQAIKMKKRGQFPNVQTFTLIFAGCAKFQHPKIAVSETVKHYNLLMTDERIKPNSIHLNAALNVCAKAGDLESMFLIADTADDSTRAPTVFTYTTILDALRADVSKDLGLKVLPKDQLERNVKRVVDRSRSLWVEVMRRWEKGRLRLDEQVICAMGRNLLLSWNLDDRREVLELVQKTMNIPNLDKDPKAADRLLGTSTNSLLVPSQDQDPSQGLSKGSIAGSSESLRDTTTDDSNDSKKLSSEATALESNSRYALPGRNTLALILTALSSFRLTTCGIKYWNVMIRHYGIVPDRDNWYRLLGMLKAGRASAQAASIMNLLPKEYVSSLPYKIAMQTCIRDNVNPYATKNALQVLKSMVTRLPVLDVQVMRLYLRVALVCHHHLRRRAKKGDIVGAKREYGIQITSALDNVRETYWLLHEHYFQVVKPKDVQERDVLYNSQREVIALARLMHALCDKVVLEKLLPEAELKKVQTQAVKLSRIIQQFYSARELMEPQLPPLLIPAGGPKEDDKYHDKLFASEDLPANQGGGFVWDTSKPLAPVSRIKKSW